MRKQLFLVFLLSTGVCFSGDGDPNKNLKAFQKGYGDQRLFQKYTRLATSYVKNVISETISGKNKIHKNQLLERVMNGLASFRHATGQEQLNSHYFKDQHLLADPSYLAEKRKKGIFLIYLGFRGFLIQMAQEKTSMTIF